LPKINQLFTICLSTVAVLSLIASVWIVYQLDPFQSVDNILYFYFASGLLVLSLTALILYSFRQRFGVREFAQRHLKLSLRQGLWIAMFYVIALFLQSKDLYTWLNSIFLFAALTFLETYFIYNERKSGTN
jgi:hypothetical protein